VNGMLPADAVTYVGLPISLPERPTPRATTKAERSRWTR
jgi:hypothetical protein